MKHSCECLIWFLKLIIKYRENDEIIKWPKSLQSKIGSPNHLYVYGLFCLNLMNY